MAVGWSVGPRAAGVEHPVALRAHVRGGVLDRAPAPARHTEANMTPIRFLVAAMALAMAQPRAAGAATDPDFALVTATGSADGSTEQPCLTGERSPGIDVVLFGRAARTCAGVTREVTEGLAGGTCTRVLLAAGCDARGLALAALGVARLERLRVLPRAPLSDPRRVAAIAGTVERLGLRQTIATRGRRWRHPEPVEVAATPSEAFVFEGLAHGPVFVRYPVVQGPRRDAHPGTIVVAFGDEVSAPFDVHALAPFAFELSGRSYLWGGSFAGDSGWRLDQIFAVERGRLRLLYETGDLST